MKAVPALRRTSPDCLSDMQLDALVCEVSSVDERARANDHLASCSDCQRRHAEFALFAQEFQQQRSDAQILGQIANVKRSRRDRRAPARTVVAAAATLCAAALLLLWFRARPDHAAGVRTKGDSFATVQVLRSGRTFVGGNGGAYFPGDTVQFAIRGDRERHIAVLDREASGAVSVFHPWQGAGSAVVQPRPSALETVLAPSIELDETLGLEWLVAVSCDAPFETAEPLRRLAEVAAPSVPALGPDDLGLPSSCALQTFELNKRRSDDL